MHSFSQRRMIEAGPTVVGPLHSRYKKNIQVMKIANVGHTFK